MLEFGTPAFWVATLQIIGADIVLSGDNAVVIALATRSLPPQQQRLAIFWGTFAAVAMRVTLTIVAVTLLKLPVLKLVGALLLLWIAVQLLLPEDEDGEHLDKSLGRGLAAAIRTILMADLVMSVDNVIAIAAIAKGHFLLLLFGLAVSIPLVIFTSTFLLRAMERYPIIITIGAALLGWVSGEMAVSDPLIADWVNANAAWLHRAAPIAGAVLVVVAGKVLAARALAGEAERPLIEVGAALPAAAEAEAFYRLLLPVDGSAAALRAVDEVIAMRERFRLPLEIHLLNVQRVLHEDVGQFVANEDARDYQREEGEKELVEARTRLERAGLACRQHVVVGETAAEAITHFAREHGIAQIVMSTHGRTALADALLGSVARGVLQRSEIPLTLVR